MFWERAGTGNLTELRKVWLLPQVRRAVRALELIEDAAITVFAAQEAGTFITEACADHPHFIAISAKPNSVVGRRKRRRSRGNVLILDDRVWEVDGEPSDKSFEIPAGPVGRLSRGRTREIHQLRVRLRHKATGEIVRFIAGHKPRNVKGYQAARNEMDDWLRHDAYEWEAQGTNVVLLFDGNGALPHLRAMKRRASVGPDSVVTSEHIAARDVVFHYWRKQRVMDHKAAVSVELGIPTDERTARPGGGKGWAAA